MSSFLSHTSSKLTRYHSASLKELTHISLPIILSLFSGSLMLFCDRFFLMRSSMKDLEICSAAFALCVLFQLPCVRIASMSQVFVGQLQGAGKISLIGSTVWQMIWFSFLSLLVTVPLSLILEGYFFKNSSIREEGMHYFHLFMATNFLFPLASALTSFFLGLGKSKIIIFSNICCHGLHLFLDYILIFGIDGWLQPQGYFGAALATVISQLLLSIWLFIFFIRKSNRITYGTGHFKIRFSSLFEGIRVGLPRAIARFSVLGVWACNTHIMMSKGEDYLMILSFGSTLVGTFIFINEGMSMGIITIASNLIGARKWQEIWRLYRSAFFFSIGTLTLLSLPLIFFSQFIIDLFFKSHAEVLSKVVLSRTCIWVWILLLSNAFNYISFGFLSASKDTTFHMVVNSLSWIVCYLPVWVFIGMWNWSPDSFWVILALEPLWLASIFHLRLRHEKWKSERASYKPSII